MSDMNDSQLPDGWVVKKLIDVCLVERGSSPRPIKKFITDDKDGVNWIKIGDTKNVDKYVCSTNQKITKEGAEKSRYVKSGDFILSNSMSFGQPYIMRTDGYIHDGWFVLRLHDFIDTEYFYHLLSSPYVNNQFHQLASGSVVKNISGDLVKKVVLPIPSLPEQQRIVAILDKAFTAIAKVKVSAEQNLKNAKELFESYLQGVFENKGEDWKEKKISEICSIKHGFAFKSQYFKDEGRFVLLTPGNFYETGGYRDRGVKQKYFNGDFPSDYILKEGDLLVAMTEQAPGLLGSPILIPASNKFLHNQRLGLITPREGIPWSNEFFYYVFNTRNNRKILHDTGTGVKVRHTSPTKIGDLIVSFPLLEEQKKIAHKLGTLYEDKIKLELLYQKKIADLEELKKSILQRAFLGEI